MQVNLTRQVWMEAPPQAFGLKAPNRDYLLDWVGERMMATGAGWKSGEPFLAVSLPCGEEKKWWSIGSVPNRSVRCFCGNLDYPHYFILYDSVLDPDQPAQEEA